MNAKQRRMLAPLIIAQTSESDNDKHIERAQNAKKLSAQDKRELELALERREQLKSEKESE